MWNIVIMMSNFYIPSFSKVIKIKKYMTVDWISLVTYLELTLYFLLCNLTQFIFSYPDCVILLHVIQYIPSPQAPVTALNP